MEARVSEPRVRVAAVIVIDDRLLLVRQSRGGTPYHLLPGGGVIRNESLSDALVREVAEETGLRIDVGEPLFISDSIAPDGDRHVVNITFRATVTGGKLAPTGDDAVLGLELVSRDALRTTDLRPPIAAELVRAWGSAFDVRTTYLGPLWSEETT